MEIAVVVASASLYATAIIFPSIEYVDEKHCAYGICSSEGMLPMGPPVWRSQIVNSQVVCVEVGNSVVGPNRINERLSGEKLSHRAIQGDSRVLIRSSVTESRISIFTGFDQATAMNLLHGDHTATSTTA